MAARDRSDNLGKPLADLLDEEKATKEKKMLAEAESDQDGFVPVSFPPLSADKDAVAYHISEVHQHDHHHAHGSLIPHHHKEGRFLDFLKAHPSKDWFQKLGIVRRLTPFSFLRKPSIVRRPSTLPTSAATATGHNHQDRRRRRGFRVPFVRSVDWDVLWQYAKDWVRKPANFGLVLWFSVCGIALFIMLLLIIGALNSVIPEATTRRRWVEIINQVLNALFTTMCLYQHPRIIHHLIMLVRWTDRDASGLRVLYCRYTEPRPMERVRLLFVLALLHITCFAQYGLCALYWVYNRHNRPDVGQILCIAAGIVAPAVAALYTLYGPLARKDIDDEESQSVVVAENGCEMIKEIGEMEMKVTSETVTANGGKVIVTEPEWVGGLFDGVLDDPPVAGLSFFCTFCVFGWNMERLGFGNMYVHVATFILLCAAPLWVFTVTGLKVNDHDVRAAVWIVGILLSFLGLLYAGFWRTKMRRRFGLPADRTSCFGYAALADYAKWLFCWTCALAQEVRTANFYDIEQESFYSKQDSFYGAKQDRMSTSSSSDDGRSSPLVPLAREGCGSGAVFGEQAAVFELERNKRSLAGEEKPDLMSAPLPTVIRPSDVNGCR